MRLLPSVLGAVALGLAGCASGPGPMGGPGGPGRPEGPPGPRPGFFVSPFGALFFSSPSAPWPVVDWFASADTDGDGRITLEEFTGDGLRQFAMLDTDRNGRLTSDEIAVYEETLAEARSRLPGAGGPRGGGPGSQRREGGPPPMGLAEPPQQGGRRSPRSRAPTGPMAYGAIAAAGFFNYPQPVKAADLDTNQTVTAQEWTQATERWFLVLDEDRDGGLTLAELPRTPLQQMMDRDRPA